MFDRASCCCADKSVVTRDVAGDAADCGTFQATLRAGERWHEECCNRDSECSENFVHGNTSCISGLGDIMSIGRLLLSATAMRLEIR